MNGMHEHFHAGGTLVTKAVFKSKIDRYLSTDSVSRFACVTERATAPTGHIKLSPTHRHSLNLTGGVFVMPGASRILFDGN